MAETFSLFLFCFVLCLAACPFGRRFWGGNVVTHAFFLVSWLVFFSWLTTESQLVCDCALLCSRDSPLLLGLCKAAPCLTHTCRLDSHVRARLSWAIRPFFIYTRVGSMLIPQLALPRRLHLFLQFALSSPQAHRISPRTLNRLDLSPYSSTIGLQVLRLSHLEYIPRVLPGHLTRILLS